MGKRKTIVCLETGKQFNSVENAANAIGVSSGFISRQIKAGKPIKGFCYYYESEKTIGDAVAAWMTAPGEMRLHAGSVNVESSEDDAAHYLETAKHLNEYLNDHGTGR